MGKVITILALFSSLLFACSEDPLSEDSLIYTGPGPTPKPSKPLITQEDLKCATLGDREFIKESVFEAVHLKEDTKEYARLLNEFELQHPRLKLKDRYPYHLDLSIVVPSDDAFKKFYALNPGIELKGDSLARLVKHHIMVEFLSLTHVLEGGRRSTTLNYEPMPIKIDANTCIFFGKEEALVTKGEDRCSNGYIHTIENVMVPW